MATLTERLQKFRAKAKTTQGTVNKYARGYIQAFTGSSSRSGKKLTKAEKKELKAQGISTRRSSMEPSKYVRSKKIKRIRQAVETVQKESMGYQNIREDRTPQPKGVTSPRPGEEQPTMMESMLPMDALREQRTIFLAEPERFKTHRSYANFDFIGKSSKKGAVSWQYDIEEMFR